MGIHDRDYMQAHDEAMGEFEQYSEPAPMVRVAALDVPKSAVLLVQTDAKLKPDEEKRLREIINDALPNRVVLILDEGLSFTVLGTDQEE